MRIWGFVPGRGTSTYKGPGASLAGGERVKDGGEWSSWVALQALLKHLHLFCRKEIVGGC